jgi:hypothetical protein
MLIGSAPVKLRWYDVFRGPWRLGAGEEGPATWISSWKGTWKGGCVGTAAKNVENQYICSMTAIMLCNAV